MFYQKIIVMFFRCYFSWAVLFFSIFIGCSRREPLLEKNHLLLKENSVFKLIQPQYAKHFAIKCLGNKKMLFIINEKKDTSVLEINSDEYFRSLAVLGTIPVFQLKLLNALSSLKAIDDIRYYNLSDIQSLYNSHDIVELLPNLQWNYEHLLKASPDIIVTYSDVQMHHAKLKNMMSERRIKQILYLDFLEEHPLGRAEWIKVMGFLLNKDSLADEVFKHIEHEYQNLLHKVTSVKNRPRVFTEVLYGDVWYIAGNKSYISKIINDAGGKYVFDFHDYENSRPFSFEYVIKYAHNADIWINMQAFNTYDEMLKANPKYALFRAFRDKKCFNNNKTVNAYGYNDYYESGICLPYLILQDLMAIFHPELFGFEKHSFHYYKPLN